jgi:hypothetical protein
MTAGRKDRILSGERKVIMPNYYDLHGHSTRIAWYPEGRGGPIREGGPAAGAPVLEYSSESLDASVSGDDLTVTKTPIGTFVTAVVKKTNIVPGGVTVFAVLIPDARVDGTHSAAIHTIGVLSVHRGTSNIGPGQLETYTSFQLKGTAANVLMAL